MHIGSKPTITPKPLIILALTASVILMACLISEGYRWWHWRQQDEAVRRLTDLYGTETQAVIENFESRWFTLDAHRNPSIQSDLATGPYLDDQGFARRGQALYDEPWLITKSAKVTRVRVLEYSPERFKAVAHSVRMRDEITPAGEDQKSLLPYQACGIYVFLRKDGVWKLASYFNLDPRYAERDWNNIPPSYWMRQIIGDIPDYLLFDCEGFLSQ